MEQRDEELWKIAQRRAKFQGSLISFVIISMILWGIWWFTGGIERGPGQMPWPLWPMFFMGIFLLFQFIKAYKTDNNTLTEKEYEKLKNQSHNKHVTP